MLSHVIVLYFVTLVAYLAAWIGYFIILFTGRQPEGFDRFITGTLAWWVRVYAWLAGLTDVYPPLAFDAPDYVARLTARTDPALLYWCVE